MELQENNVVLAPSRRGRKKISDKSKWKREVEKSKRHMAKGPPNIEPEVYFDVFKKYGTVLRLGSDFQFYDWKTRVTNVLKPPGSWHFQFNASKRFFLRRDKNNKIAIKGEPNYISEVVNYGNVCKRGKSYENIEPTLMNIGVLVKDAKLKDVRNLLLKHFGEDWASYESLKYYKFLQEDKNESNLEETDSEETLMGEEVDIRVW